VSVVLQATGRADLSAPHPRHAAAAWPTNGVYLIPDRAARLVRTRPPPTRSCEDPTPRPDPYFDHRGILRVTHHRFSTSPRPPEALRAPPPSGSSAGCRDPGEGLGSRRALTGEARSSGPASRLETSSALGPSRDAAQRARLNSLLPPWRVVVEPPAGRVGTGGRGRRAADRGAEESPERDHGGSPVRGMRVSRGMYWIGRGNRCRQARARRVSLVSYRPLPASWTADPLRAAGRGL